MELQNTEKLKHLIRITTLDEKEAVIDDMSEVILQKHIIVYVKDVQFKAHYTLTSQMVILSTQTDDDFQAVLSSSYLLVHDMAKVIQERHKTNTTIYSDTLITRNDLTIAICTEKAEPVLFTMLEATPGRNLQKMNLEQCREIIQKYIDRI